MKKIHDIRIGITTTSMGNGHMMKAIAIARAIEDTAKLLKSSNINIRVKIIDEAECVSFVVKGSKKFFELIYKMLSRSEHLRHIWDEGVLNPDISGLEFSESLFSRINKHTGGKIVRFDKSNEYDVVISTYSSDRVASFPPGTQFVRVNPDIFCHTYHFIRMKGMNEWYILSDRELRERVLAGKEKTVLRKYIPEADRILVFGAIVHPENIAIHKDKSHFDKLKKMHKLPVMLQIGGAGAQQGIFLEAMKHIDYRKVSPLFAAGRNKRFFVNLLKQALSLHKITDKEYMYALAGKFDKLKFRKGIITFSSGLRILYHPDDYKAVEFLDIAKSENLINFVKPGDVTSAGTVLSLLYHVGSHEIENADWVISSGFGEWLVMPEEYMKMKKEMRQREYEKIFGKKAAIIINNLDMKKLEKQHESLRKVNYGGAYNVAAFAILLGMNKKKEAKNLEYMEKIIEHLKSEGLCTIDKKLISQMANNS